MIKHFTTPEFADLLKQHGIEIDTPFYRYFDIVSPTVDRIGVDYKYGMLDINSRYMAHWPKVCQPKPAYLLSEVLTWLPEKAIIDGSNCCFFYEGDINSTIYGYQTNDREEGLSCDTIEQLITQGLTEGWLNKQIIEQQIKDNQ